MPEGVTAEEKGIIRRVVPKAQNKILAAAMVRLYIAYPNASKWTYTGLQGAVVLANDLIGNTFWLKLVDVSVWQPSPFLNLVANSYSLQCVVSYGIKRYMKIGLTTKIVSFSIASKLKIAQLDYLFLRKKRLSSS